MTKNTTTDTDHDVVSALNTYETSAKAALEPQWIARTRGGIPLTDNPGTLKDTLVEMRDYEHVTGCSGTYCEHRSGGEDQIFLAAL